jgi:THO complex subunit 5
MATAVNGIVSDPFLRSVLDISSFTRLQAIALLDLAEQNPTSNAESIPKEVQLKLSKEHKKLNSYLAQLRGLHRDAIFRVRQTKQQTAEARQEIDRLHLQLQNLYYEQRHLRGEIAACEAYEYVLHNFYLIHSNTSS